MVYRAGCLYRSVLPIKQKSNGNLLISFYEHIYEYTMLGGVVNDIYLPGWYQHHETRRNAQWQLAGKC